MDLLRIRVAPSVLRWTYMIFLLCKYHGHKWGIALIYHGTHHGCYDNMHMEEFAVLLCSLSVSNGCYFTTCKALSEMASNVFVVIDGRPRK